MSDRTSGRRAIVIGAGIGGLAAAQVLADHFERVVVLERDAHAEHGAVRPGVPQGRHPHVLLSGGCRALVDLFPGIDQDLMDAGAVALDAGYDACHEMPERFPRRHLGVRTFSLSRPLLETVIRRHVAERDNIVLRGRCRGSEIMRTGDGRFATGVRCVFGDKGLETLPAELVVDATGRGAPTLGFLAAIGHPEPAETRIGVELSYATASLTLPPSAQPDFLALMTIGTPPDGSRAGYLTRIEDDRWLALLVGRGSDRPPADRDAFLAYAARLETPTLHDAIRPARFTGEIARFGFPESVRRNFTAAGRLPRGVLPIADTICRFNPVYGQGMTVALQEACILQRLLRAGPGRPDAIATLGQDFLVEAEALLDGPWAMSALPDLAYPQTTGPRPADLQNLLRFQIALGRVAMCDPAVHKLLWEVRHLLRPLAALQDPALVRRAQAEMAAA
ncbi:MAG: NAD(P)-binding protein [Acetobacteraceae bacterium]